MIGYKCESDTVTLIMSTKDYQRLMLILGTRLGQAKPDKFWEIVEFVNEMNAQNPDFRPYAVPQEEKDK